MEKRYTQEISNHLNQSVFHRGMFHVIHKISFKECFHRRKSITPFGYVLDILTHINCSISAVSLMCFYPRRNLL